MELSKEDKEVIKHKFNNWLELEDTKKSLSSEQKELIADVSEILECKKGLVSKLFSFLEKKMEKGEDELDELNEISLLLEE